MSHNKGLFTSFYWYVVYWNATNIQSTMTLTKFRAELSFLKIATLQCLTGGGGRVSVSQEVIQHSSFPPLGSMSILQTGLMGKVYPFWTPGGKRRGWGNDSYETRKQEKLKN